MSHRHRARRLALQCLCCLDVQGAEALEKLHAFIDDSREHREVLGSAHQMFTETLTTLDKIDQLLIRHARHWELPRLALVDRNILRLATWELRSGRTPVKVVISEALKLAGEFSTAESARFVNGVLDAIAKALSRDEETGGEDS